NEEAVRLFLGEYIGFGDIARLVEETMQNHEVLEASSLEQVLAADAWAREHIVRHAGIVGR
ncbi:MAG TPA: 1-deoxy-D-xylulose-5-phosphate reductoisomerase, partial [Firmicutes bacterium]|nr:1-deoxy-D-xylulose-5-phosphate reductoisomerase [Bacillota bacterium]